MEKVFSPVAARKAQEEYCKNKRVPHFAPNDGVCFRCKKDIYQQHGLRGYETGISLNEANTTHVIYCPHCNFSYCN